MVSWTFIACSSCDYLRSACDCHMTVVTWPSCDMWLSRERHHVIMPWVIIMSCDCLLTNEQKLWILNEWMTIFLWTIFLINIIQLQEWEFQLMKCLTIFDVPENPNKSSRKWLYYYTIGYWINYMLVFMPPVFIKCTSWAMFYIISAVKNILLQKLPQNESYALACNISLRPAAVD